jgi:hypothetical protein
MQSDKERKYKLIRRQLNDIVAQIEKVKYSRYFRQEIQEFSKYSSELKNYILQNVTEREILEIANQITEIDINSFNRFYWYHYLIFPWYLTLSYNDLLAKDDILPILDSLKTKYNIMDQLISEIIEIEEEKSLTSAH